MDLATLTNAPREVTLAGKIYTVSALTLSEWGRLQAWLKDHAEDPVARALAQLARARASGVAVASEDRTELLREARLEARTWPPRVASAAWFEAIDGAEGGAAAFLVAVLGKHQPGFTADDAKRLADDPDLKPGELATLTRRALGYDDPKAPGAATTDPTDPSSTTGA